MGVWEQMEAVAKRADLEINEKQSQVEDLRASNVQLDLLNTQLTQQSDISAQTILGLRDEIAVLTDSCARLTAELARRDALMTMRFGACPAKGGESLAAAQTVINKWGKGAAVRQFLGAGVAQRPEDASLVHISWKPSVAQLTLTWVKAVTANLRPGDCVEVWHEADKKVSDKILAFEDVVSRKNTFYDLVKQARPDLLVVNTLTGWLFDPKSGKNPNTWAVVKADVLGVDCDGVRPTKLPYTNYEDETKAALTFLAEHGGGGLYRYFSVPEFGCPRIPTEDPEGKIRTEYHDYYARLWNRTGKCLYATLYEYNSSPNYSLETPAEIDGWRAWV